MTRACFEPASFIFSRSVMAGSGGFTVVARAAVDLGKRFFADFGIGILDSVYGGVAPHHRSPTSANKPAGQDSWAFMAPGLDDSTAPIADECQSFLDHVVAQFGRQRAWNDRPGSEFRYPLRENSCGAPHGRWGIAALWAALMGVGA
jgi:hypothetical protein